jgi:hypothetical protein
MKQKKQKPIKKRSNKYQKPLSLYGISEIEAVKEILKSPPAPKQSKKKSK